MKKECRINLMEHHKQNLINTVNGISTRKFVVVLVLAIPLSVLIGWMLGGSGLRDLGKNNINLLNGSGSSLKGDSFDGVFSSSEYLNPRLQCGDIESFSNGLVYNIKDQINDYINETGRHPESLKKTSVYFRDLNGGPIFGINDQEKFIPGSLLKLPLMLSLLKKAESDSEFLNKKIIFDGGGDENYGQYYPAKESVAKEGVYSVSDLIDKMIVFSDNNSALLLKGMLSDKEFDEAFDDLGVNSPKDAHYTLTVQTYASYFRILYNASYINSFLSSRALRLLSKSDFKVGLVAGVPDTINVAHKFGERSGEGLDQLHDCGIVYYPDHPYVLCVMTRGENFPDLAKTIKDISKIVYDNIRREYPAK